MRISDWSSDVCSSDRVLAWLILFASSVAWVFIQGFQSRNVNNGNYGLAACSSFAMGFSQVYVLSKVISSASILHTLVYCTGGALGIVLAMYVHRRFVRSEEHTSELQSLMSISYAVSCLKKKNNKKHKSL